jgi:hypothetical protein
MKKYHYSYITTNIINGKKYVGDHSTNNIDDGYLGSGLYLKRAIKKYGKENFNKKIISFFNCKGDAFNEQKKLIIKYNSLRPNGYNISPTGGHNVKNCFSKETIEKLRIGSSKPKSEEHKEKIRLGVKKHIELYGQSTAMLGKKHSNKTKEKQSKSHKRKIMSEQSKEKNKIAHLGKNISSETRKKMSESAKKRWKNKNK